MKKKQKTNPVIKGLSLILIAAAGWRLYKLFNTSADNMMLKWGITGSYLPDIVIFVSILIIIVGLYMLGSHISASEAVKRILKLK